MSVWYPIVLVMIVIGLCAGLIIYQHARLIVAADRIAEKTAYVWDNSHKRIDTGALERDARDGLYWRLISDGLLPLVSGGTSMKIVLEIPVDQPEQLRSLPLRKLERSSSLIPHGTRGEITFQNTLLERRITVQLRKPLRLPLWLHALFGSELEAEASAIVSDPVEYLRTIDLIRTYTGIANHVAPEKAKSLFKDPMPDGEAVDVDSHEEAVAWLRMYTGGTETTISTSLGDRLIDSLTADMTAHQAFYTYREKQVLTQADKDAELLRHGKVDRVVWHFFLGTGNRLSPPSESLMRELAERGIQVVIHPGGVAFEE